MVASMLRRLILAAAAVVISCAGAVTVTAPAQANEPWVTRAEYRKATKGMAKARVHAIFDFAGVRVLSPSRAHLYESRHYRTRRNGVAKCFAIDYQRRKGV
jgi:hypothetical protein